MREANKPGVNRREFLIQSGLAAGAVAGGLMGGCASVQPAGDAGRKFTGVYLAYDAKNPVMRQRATQWALAQLEQSLRARNIWLWKADTLRDIQNASETELRIIVDHKPAESASLAVGMKRNAGRKDFLIQGTDSQQMVYALSEAADIVNLHTDALSAMDKTEYRNESPANPVRSVMRMFCTDIEDKQWFNDRSFWKEYLTMLVSNRFNRFNLSLGLGYDFATQLRDTYFYFAYPFLLDVPGYKVRATNVSNAERDRNLEMLRLISDETVARGMEFQLGIWTHAYVWQNSPNANHVIEGLTPDKHAAYCQDALALLLKECPSISGVTLRIHGESGVNEGSYDFWKSVFHGAVQADRNIRLDLHAKGIDQGMIDTALATGLPLTVSPKYWAEHMGLPYHQAAIRPTELPTRARGSSDLMALSTGARSFTRYGYGDLLDDDRKFSVLHRMWPGTQRVMLWGDPVFAAAYSRSSSFCGSVGCELMEPMSFKGRKGSGVSGGRDSYADSTLHAAGGEFEKYRYYYRLWGRLLYNPDADPKTWQRQLAKDYGAEAAGPVEQALAHSSRILPLFTTAHTPAAANNNYWPEMYVNQSIVDGARKAPYTETPIPCRFGTISPLDPQMFSRIDDEVQALIDGRPTGKYTPAEVAQWLEQLSSTAAKHLADAHAKAADLANAPAFRRMAIDVTVCANLGRFFARKIRAASLWGVYNQGSHSKAALQAALTEYRSARDAWTQIVEQTRSVYAPDVSYGIDWFQRGHWSDRLAAIESDIAAMEAQLATAVEVAVPASLLAAAIHPNPRPDWRAQHTPAAQFNRGQALPLELSIAGLNPASVECLYRRVHQAEPWNSISLSGNDGKWMAEVPASTTGSSFPMQYYFRFANADGQSALYPGFNPTLSNQPISRSVLAEIVSQRHAS